MISSSHPIILLRLLNAYRFSSYPILMIVLVCHVRLQPVPVFPVVSIYIMANKSFLRNNDGKNTSNGFRNNIFMKRSISSGENIQQRRNTSYQNNNRTKSSNAFNAFLHLPDLRNILPRCKCPR